VRSETEPQAPPLFPGVVVLIVGAIMILLSAVVPSRLDLTGSMTGQAAGASTQAPPVQPAVKKDLSGSTS
jgi:hypothetical protein